MGVSTASRVVPGTGLTMARSSPSRRLSSELLPTLGRPTMAILTDVSSAGIGLGEALSTATSASSISPLPFGHLAVGGGGAGADIGHKDDRVGLRDGHLGLRPDLWDELGRVDPQR